MLLHVFFQACAECAPVGKGIDLPDEFTDDLVADGLQWSRHSAVPEHSCKSHATDDITARRPHFDSRLCCFCEKTHLSPSFVVDVMPAAFMTRTKGRARRISAE